MRRAATSRCGATRTIKSAHGELYEQDHTAHTLRRPETEETRTYRHHLVPQILAQKLRREVWDDRLLLGTEARITRGSISTGAFNVPAATPGYLSLASGGRRRIEETGGRGLR